jgi:hypothetical protein
LDKTTSLSERVRRRGEVIVTSPLRVVWVSSDKGGNDKSFEVLLPCRGK